jgi:hypothetical protein
MCESLILDAAMSDYAASPAGAGDRRGAGIGFQKPHLDDERRPP